MAIPLRMAAFLALAALPGAAQDRAPAFEVVSIKPRGPVMPVKDSEGRRTQSTTPFQSTEGRLAVEQP